MKFEVPRAECLCGVSRVYVRTVALAWRWHLSPSTFQGSSEKPEAGLHHKLSLTETDWLNLHLFLKDKHMGKGPEIHLPVSGAKENWSLSSSPSLHMLRDEMRVGVSEEGQCLVNNECISQEVVLGCQSHEHPDTRQCKDCKGQQMRCSAEEPADKTAQSSHSCSTKPVPAGKSYKRRLKITLSDSTAWCLGETWNSVVILWTSQSTRMQSTSLDAKSLP